MNLARYRKGIVAGVGCLIAIAGRHLGADSFIVFDLIAVATAFGVYRVPNA